MRNLLYPVSVFFLLLSSCSSKPQSASLSEIFSKIDAEVREHNKGYSALEEATRTIGHRLTGSENGHKAEEFSSAFFKDAGFENVRFEPFEMEAWTRDSASMWIEPAHTSVSCVALAHTPVEADTVADIVWLGSGLKKDFASAGDRVKGRIALMSLQLQKADSTSKNLHRSEKTALAIEAGAAGVIFINQVDGDILLTGTASTNGKLIPIPVICVSASDGATIRTLVENNPAQAARISMKNHFTPVKARNVIATLEGGDLANEKIIIGGHLDSWDLASGAIDNGLGSFTVLEVARAFKALNIRPRRTIEFVSFMGEEQGLLGSKSMVAQLKADGKLASVRYMVNLDMSGNANGFSFSGRDEMKPWADSIGKMISQIDTVFGNKNGFGAGLHSDHQPFLLEGVPVMGMVSELDKSIYKCYHADCDHFNLVNKEHMINGARFMAMMLYAIADAEIIPSKRLNELEIKEFMIKNGLQEELEVAGLWRW